MSFYADENARYEIGIKICEFDYQEKGLGRIALSMLIEELFILRYVGSNSYCQMICLLYLRQ